MRPRPLRFHPEEKVRQRYVSRVAGVVFLLVTFASSAQARTQELQGGVSRDGSRAVVLHEDPRHRITYEIVTWPNGSVLHRVLSNYQLEGRIEEWARHEAADAEVYWSPRSDYVAIDEAPYHHGGEVFLVDVEKMRDIHLPREGIIAATHCRWERYRIRVQHGWHSDRELSLTLGGYAVRETLSDGRRVSLNRTFDVQLRIERDRAIVLSCRETTS